MVKRFWYVYDVVSCICNECFDSVEKSTLRIKKSSYKSSFLFSNDLEKTLVKKFVLNIKICVISGMLLCIKVARQVNPK